MLNYYTNEINTQIVIALLKEHGIKKVIASPGTTNMPLVASMQQDSYFEMFSSVDERSAAYIACGLSAESGETVVLSCTGATASRNYLPGLTEAFYRKLPILAITSTQTISKIGQHIAQVIDRSSLPKDVVNYSVYLPLVKDEEDLWDCEIKVNKAILELSRHGGGPVHINLATGYSINYDTKELPRYRSMYRITEHNNFPELPKGKIAIFVGSHKIMDKRLSNSIDVFCATNNAVVFCDNTSNYYGKYRTQYALVAGQRLYDKSESRPDLLIHIGEITGDYATLGIGSKEVWRVNEDGEIRDTFRKLKYIFEMPEYIFFEYYSKNTNNGGEDSLLHFYNLQLNETRKKIPELPFSNIWLAAKMAHLIPAGSTIHFGILNSLRSWNFFELPDSVTSSSNVGGFGIDGSVSSLLGASLANRNKLYFGVVGDLAFFYDMNAIGNRHLGKNIRILLINNGKGTEFRQFNHKAAQFGQDADEYIAAAGHFGNKSLELVKNYAQSLGFEYMSASNKKEFIDVYKRFLTPEFTNRPMLFEVFTNSEEESKALEIITSLEINTDIKAKEFAKKMLGRKGVELIKRVIK
ncbi:2-succinyl-5-enolpyruvyl-6-hydroxy-3-cyclohexene-1-carboxylate synthase [bioreactor metagenome]|uniref:2-succinyl-5-enolpyruvyl-6-hydroxy-3-cyclohexene-1-carboxylate synthase n=1 Tax=bioreactor metagenome TaxID=1076179 RepID=A0A644Z493_9ZZZZ